MDPFYDPARPNPIEPPAPFRGTPRLIPALFTLVMIALLTFSFGVVDIVMHPLALAFGKPAMAVVSSKRVSHARHSSGNYVALNYQYSPDYAPRPELKVNWTAYQALTLEQKVAIHYIPGCSSCIALDEDYGSARDEGIVTLIIALVVGAWVGFGKLAARIKNRP